MSARLVLDESQHTPRHCPLCSRVYATARLKSHVSGMNPKIEEISQYRESVRRTIESPIKIRLNSSLLGPLVLLHTHRQSSAIPLLACE